jgi:hypothetical protein
MDIDNRTNDEVMLKEVLRSHRLPYIGAMAHRVSYRRAPIAGKIAAEIDPKAALELEQIVKCVKLMAVR